MRGLRAIATAFCLTAAAAQPALAVCTQPSGHFAGAATQVLFVPGSNGTTSVAGYANSTISLDINPNYSGQLVFNTATFLSPIVLPSTYTFAAAGNTFDPQLCQGRLTASIGIAHFNLVTLHFLYSSAESGNVVALVPVAGNTASFGGQSVRLERE